MTWRMVTSRRTEDRMRITAHMTEPLVYTGGILHIDGIIASAVYAELSGNARQRMPPLSSGWVTDLKLPLARWACPTQDGMRKEMEQRRKMPGEVWGWLASGEVVEWLSRGKAEIRKKPALDEMARYARDKTVSLGSGTLKAYDLALPTTFAHAVTWYATGDRARIEQLLNEHVPAIGRKRGLGWGTVRKWAVDPWPHDWAVEIDGSAVRRMPLSSGLAGIKSYGAVRPPYHHRSRIMRSVEPCR